MEKDKIKLLDQYTWINKVDKVEIVHEGELKKYIFTFDEFDEFLGWINGQTCIEIGYERSYYPCDVIRFINNLPVID